jgi:hypothetical protein
MIRNQSLLWGWKAEYKQASIRKKSKAPTSLSQRDLGLELKILLISLKVKY